MSRRSGRDRDTVRLMELYNTRAHGLGYAAVLHLKRTLGLDEAIKQLEGWELLTEKLLKPT
jgi:hypothetical protein